ncbi:hypothetical protein OKW46_004525 [Paraburkholderia sp. WSM4179]|nr:hypothetical protein [Paraburkholderia sp. WSM4179]
MRSIAGQLDIKNSRRHCEPVPGYTNPATPYASIINEATRRVRYTANVTETP